MSDSDVGNEIDCVVTAHVSGGGQASATADGSVVEAAGPSLPTPSFGADNLRLWIDTHQTTFMLTDATGGTTTVAAIEDLSGHSRGFANGDKSSQPKLGPNGGILFDADGQTLTSFLRDVANGLSKVSIYAAFRLDSASYGASSKRRCIIAMTEAASTATPPGSGSSQERLAAHLSGGSSGRKPFSSVSIMDGTFATTSTTTPAIPSMATDTKVHAGWEYDLSQTVASQAIYENGTLAGTYTWTPTETNKQLNTADSVLVSLGNRATPTGANSGTLFGELLALVVLADTPDATRRSQINTYLNGVIA